MSELLPPNPDEWDIEPTTIFDDLMASPQWPALCDAIDDWESQAVIYDRDISDDQQGIMQHGVAHISTFIGPEYYGKPCTVLALAYDDKAEGMDRAEPVSLSKINRSWFTGCEMQYISGRWRILLEIMTEMDDPVTIVSSDDGQPYQNDLAAYYVRPNSDQPDVDGLVELKVSPDDDEGEARDELLNREAVSGLHVASEDIASRIAQPDFIAMAPADQRALLADHVAEIEAGFPRQLRNCQLVIDCAADYIGFEGMPGLAFKTYNNHDALPADQRKSVRTGEVIDFSHIELEDLPPNLPLTPDLFLHGGAPCMNVRPDSNDGTIYHLPLTMIRDLM